LRHSDLVCVAFVALAAAACTRPSTASPTTSASIAVVTPSPEQFPTLAPSPSASSTPAKSFVLPNPVASPFAPDLEARLPAELRGIPMIRYSGPIAPFASGGDMCILLCPEETRGLASASGMDLDDLRLAIAVPPDDSGLAVQIIAIQFPGLDSDLLIPARLKGGGHSSDRAIPPEVRTLSAGAETVAWVQWLPLFPEANQVEYLYARDDVLYIINGLLPDGDKAPVDVTLAVEALARL
jgi:hypothetical protein